MHARPIRLLRPSPAPPALHGPRPPCLPWTHASMAPCSWRPMSPGPMAPWSPSHASRPNQMTLKGLSACPPAPPAPLAPPPSTHPPWIPSMFDGSACSALHGPRIAWPPMDPCLHGPMASMAHGSWRHDPQCLLLCGSWLHGPMVPWPHMPLDPIK